ncbi:TetR/AcrR family transcriptional regulator [Variovorax sp. VNK109]|jgi:AcrR family transcriptional regulator|uniref:TetR/AcrR family transcriptional regulator n=1 Tax=Variovorax sp. VNK109 TaxID=3400919 RepID=UPI003C04494E
MSEDTSARDARRRGPVAHKHIDILWTAAQLFAQRGIAQTSTREIAAAAGTTERTLFKHFGSKDGLTRAVIDEAVLPHLVPASLEGLRQAVQAHQGDLAAWHASLLRARSVALAEAPELTRLLLVELLRDEALRARFASQWLVNLWEPLLAFFTRLQRDKRIARDMPVDALARMFLSLNVGYLVGRHVLATGLDWDDEAEIGAISRLFARGCAPG